MKKIASRISSILFIISILALVSCRQPTIEQSPYEELFSYIYDSGIFNGNVLVFRDGETIFQEAYGTANIETDQPLTINSQFRMASVSKQFTATAIMILKEKGSLKYEQYLSDFFPNLPYGGITIRHLLNHTSGLPDYEALMDENWKPELEYNDPDRFVSGNKDVIDIMIAKAPKVDFNPGEKWEYSNTGYLILASIVAKVSGLPFETFLKENIFNPAGMKNTSVYNFVPGIDANMPNRVFGYKEEGSIKIPEDSHYINPVQGDGGIYSTLLDLLIWDRIMHTEDIISFDTREEAYTPAVLNNGDTTNYGFGVFIDQSPSGLKTIEHSGGWVGFVTYLYRGIEDNNCIILLTNNSTSYSSEVLESLKNILYDLPYEIPKIKIRDPIKVILEDKGIEAALAEYKRLKSTTPNEYDFGERNLSDLAFQYFRNDKIDIAIKILHLNSTEFPTFGGNNQTLGYIYQQQKDTNKAIENYKIAMQKDSTLQYSKNQLELLEGQ